MAGRLSEAKAKAIAVEYCSNDYKKVLALLSVGYSKSYANNAGLKLFDNSMVKKNVEKIQALAVIETGFTLEKAQEMYEEAFDLGKVTRQPAAMNGSVTGIARLYGMDKDAGAKDQTIIVISPKQPED